MFYAVTPERSSFRENIIVSDAAYMVSFVERLVARDVRCPVTTD